MINFDSKEAALVGLNSSLKTSVIPDDDIAGLRNLVRDYYYFKDLQSTVVLKLNAELKVSFPAYLKVFSKITTKFFYLQIGCPKKKKGVSHNDDIKSFRF